MSGDIFCATHDSIFWGGGGGGGGGMVFYAIFNNVTVVLWRSVLMVEETRVPGENHRSAASH